MKILVCISKSPDTTSKIAFTDNNTKFDETGVQYIVNPYDEWYALVRAIELKEQNGGTVTTVTVGNVSDDSVIRKALAIGADNAVRINQDANDAYTVAFQISEYAKNENFDIIITGKETINFNGAQLGGMISELMDIPYIAMASKLEIAGTVATANREIVGGEQIVEVNTPFVISASKGMAEQRIPNMRGIMAARTKPLTVIEPVACDALISYESFSLPDSKQECKYIDPNNMTELVELLHNEAKVI